MRLTARVRYKYGMTLRIVAKKKHGQSYYKVHYLKASYFTNLSWHRTRCDPHYLNNTLPFITVIKNQASNTHFDPKSVFNRTAYFDATHTARGPATCNITSVELVYAHKKKKRRGPRAECDGGAQAYVKEKVKERGRDRE